MIRGNSTGHRSRSHNLVIGSVHRPVEDVSFFMGSLRYRLGQVELEEETHCSSPGGVLGTDSSYSGHLKSLRTIGESWRELQWSSRLGNWSRNKELVIFFL